MRWRMKMLELESYIKVEKQTVVILGPIGSSERVDRYGVFYLRFREKFGTKNGVLFR